MSTTPRNLPRFLPTLTEVVEPSDFARAAAPAGPAIEEIVQIVMQQMQGVIENRLSEEIDAVVRSLVAEQLPGLQLHLRQELEPGVRQAVLEAITRRSEA